MYIVYMYLQVLCVCLHAWLLGVLYEILCVYTWLFLYIMYFAICNVYTCIAIISNLYLIKHSLKWYIKYIKRWSNVWYSYLNVPTLCEIQTAKLRPLLGAQRLFVEGLYRATRRGLNRATGPLSSRSRLKDCSML